MLGAWPIMWVGAGGGTLLPELGGMGERCKLPHREALRLYYFGVMKNPLMALMHV